MNTRVSAANLSQAAKELNFEWEQTKLSWADQKSRQFEGDYLDPLPSHLARSLAAMDEIDSLLRKIRIACE